MYCIPRSIWIEKSNNQSEILMKLISASTYNIYLKDWDMYYINQIAQVYDEISRIVVLWLQYLQDIKSEEIQQF